MKRGYIIKETIGIYPINSKAIFTIKGTKEELEKLKKAVEEEYPELVEETNDE